MEAAMEFLADTDETFAEAKAQLLRSEILVKRVRARVIVNEEGPMDLRKAKAEAHPQVGEADEGLIESTLAFESLKARRSRAEIVIDVFRTLEASRRKT